MMAQITLAEETCACCLCFLKVEEIRTGTLLLFFSFCKLLSCFPLVIFLHRFPFYAKKSSGCNNIKTVFPSWSLLRNKMVLWWRCLRSPSAGETVQMCYRVLKKHNYQILCYITFCSPGGTFLLQVCTRSGSLLTALFHVSTYWKLLLQDLVMGKEYFNLFFQGITRVFKVDAFENSLHKSYVISGWSFFSSTGKC